MANETKRVVFDFDGVIHSYVSGWIKEDVIPDPPVKGIKEAIDRIRSDGYEVVVQSTRCMNLAGRLAVNKWLEENGIVVDAVVEVKPPAICYIDDRAIRFDGHPEALLEEIRNFKPWNKDIEKSNEILWAEREVEFALRFEPREGYDYAADCYNRALKAYKILIGNSPDFCRINLTRGILNNMLEYKPLSPIEDTDDVWNEPYSADCDNIIRYQCNRLLSLFKDVYPDGSVKYSDVDRVLKIVRNKNNTRWHSGLADKIVDEIDPIIMPYYPTSDSYEVICEDYLTDIKNGDYDTTGVFYIIIPGGKRIEVNRYFKEDGKDFVEIDKKEYESRKLLDEKTHRCCKI